MRLELPQHNRQTYCGNLLASYWCCLLWSSIETCMTADYIGAVRVFGIADKLLFEQLTKLDNQDMIMWVIEQSFRYCFDLLRHLL